MDWGAPPSRRTHLVPKQEYSLGEAAHIKSAFWDFLSCYGLGNAVPLIIHTGVFTVVIPLYTVCLCVCANSIFIHRFPHQEEAHPILMQRELCVSPGNPNSSSLMLFSWTFKLDSLERR